MDRQYTIKIVADLGGHIAKFKRLSATGLARASIPPTYLKKCIQRDVVQSNAISYSPYIATSTPMPGIVRLICNQLRVDAALVAYIVFDGNEVSSCGIEHTQHSIRDTKICAA